jgi:hypothetical protein
MWSVTTCGWEIMITCEPSNAEPTADQQHVSEGERVGGHDLLAIPVGEALGAFRRRQRDV